METRVVTENKRRIAVLRSDGLLITDAQSALDLMATVSYENDCDCFMLRKEAIVEDFFVLRSGVAGEIAQKFVNYGKKLAIVGDFGGYASKPLQDFIRESNRGNSLVFAATEQEGIARLAGRCSI